MSKRQVRHWVVMAVVLLLFCVISWRVLDLAYFSRGKYIKSLERVRRSTAIIPAKRGTIFDRNLSVLAFDETKIILGVDPYAADVEKDFQSICTLSEILCLDMEDVLEKFVKKKEIKGKGIKKIRWVPICEIGSDSLYSSIKMMKIRGVYGLRNGRRSYQLGQAAAHITGFVNAENVAVCGVEKYMNFYLRGQDGYVESEKDSNARELVHYRKNEFPCEDGNDVVLSIDKNIQRIVYEQVEAIVEKFSPQYVSAIVSDVASGEILALVNYPGYDPNNYGNFPLETMKNLAVCNIYEPASVFKIVAMSFGLEYGLVDENTVFDCAESTVVNRGKIVAIPKDHRPFDKLTFVEAVRKSSNRAAAQVAMMIGEQGFYDCVRAYGFGEKSGYGPDNESGGILFPVSRWDVLTITRMAMGHAIGVVPMQVHFAMSVIANDGVLLKPNLFKCVRSGESEILAMNPVVRRRVISRDTAARMRNVLHDPWNGKLKNGMEFCGKTGTGQKLVDGKYSHDRHTSSYSGFFPLNAPKIIITVIVDDAKVSNGVAWGAVVSLPAFRNIAEKISQYLDL
ncbi:MAG: penicillin-binding protein 2 [Puniceicoccales bacterium]|jgi:cell division protein FtsI/penicillin-binding protein 2|nr:penicillin-binding protein 2 [Puniceicoccales bacterium]